VVDVRRAWSWLTHTIWEHRWSFVVLVPVGWLVPWLPEDSGWIFAIPLVALLVGMILQPRHVWVVWLGAALLMIPSMLVWLLFNDPTPQPEGQEESAIEIIPITLFLGFFGVLLPAWLGRLLRAWYEQNVRRGGHQAAQS
jgi:hypothetical protein